MSTVALPDISSLLGDKLTAFAPNTTGILYIRQRPLEIVKQLYDVALLFDHANDLNAVRQTFDKLADQEIAFRTLAISSKEVLDDVFDTAFLLAKRDPNDPRFGLLLEGIRRVNNYVLTDFRIEQAITAGAKAAYLSQLLGRGKSIIERYKHSGQIADWTVTNVAFNRLNKLKKFQPDAFYYWYMGLETMMADS